MFIHLVLFKIQRKNIPLYKRDCKIWGQEVRKHPGLIQFFPMRRTNQSGQYATYFSWKSESFHKRFMKKHHDRLVSLSHCPVEVLGYYNFTTI